jgi:predicted Zn-dependent peptidase
MFLCAFKKAVIRKWTVIIFLLICTSDYPAFAASHMDQVASGIDSLPLPRELRYPPLNFRIPDANRTLLENGTILYSTENRELPLVDVTLVVRMGSDNDPQNKAGLAELTGRALRIGGVAGMSGAAVDEALEKIAADLSVTVNQDYTVIHLSVLGKDLESGLALLAKIIMKPAFEEARIRLEKDLKVEDLRRIADDPQRLCFREFRRLFYSDNPRGNLPTLSSVLSIQRNDIIEFYRKFFFPKNIMIAVTGDISSLEATSVTRRHLSSWSVNQTPQVVLPAPKVHKSGLFFIKKDISQAIIVSGRLAPAKAQVDAYPFAVLDFIVGSGGFRSRIFHEVRSKRGLAYSTGSFYNQKQTYGLFVTYAFTKPESTLEVTNLIQSILDNYSKNPAEVDELRFAKDSISSSFIFSFTTADQATSQRLMVEFDGLPDDYLEAYRDRIEKVTKEDIRRVYSHYLSKGEGALTLILGPESAYQDIRKYFSDVHVIEPIY